MLINVMLIKKRPFSTERIYSCLDRNEVVRVAVLDISKAFDRVWHAGFLHKLLSMTLEEMFFTSVPFFKTANENLS